MPADKKTMEETAEILNTGTKVVILERFTFVVFQIPVPLSLTSTVPDSEALRSGARLTFVLLIGLKLVMTWVCHFCPLVSTQ
jgi:hypothetical protein